MVAVVVAVVVCCGGVLMLSSSLLLLNGEFFLREYYCWRAEAIFSLIFVGKMCVFCFTSNEKCDFSSEKP